MKKIYTSEEPVSAHLLKDILGQHGIMAVIQGEDAFSMRGIFTGGVLAGPTVWVLEEEEKAALEIVNDFKDSSSKQ